MKSSYQPPVTRNQGIVPPLLNPLPQRGRGKGEGVLFGLLITGYWLLIVLPFISSGCGYTNKTVLPQNIKTVYVNTVKNDIPIEQVYAYEPGLEIAITNAIIRRFQRDGNLRVVSRDQADAVLDAKMVGFEQDGVRFSKLESVEEYRLFIVLSMKLSNGKTGEIILEEPHFSGDAEYFVSNVRSIARQEAAQRAIERLARNVVDRIAEDW